MQSIHGEAIRVDGSVGWRVRRRHKHRRSCDSRSERLPLIYYDFDDGWGGVGEWKPQNTLQFNREKNESNGAAEKYTAIRSRWMCFMFIFTALQNELCASRVTLVALGSDEATSGSKAGASEEWVKALMNVKCNNIIMLLKLKHEQQFIIW